MWKIRILWIMLAALVGNGAAFTASAQDFVLLEVLIQSHKDRSDKLKERMNLKTQGSAMTAMETDKTEDYEDVVEKLSNRMNGLMSYVTFASDMLVLERLAEEVVRLEGQAIRATVESINRDQELLDTGIGIHNEFTQMLERIIKRSAYVVSAGLGVTMATQEQRKEFTNQTGEDLRNMRYLLLDFLRFVKMSEHLRASNSSTVDRRISLMEALERYKIASFEIVKEKLPEHMKQLYEGVRHE